MRHFNSRDRSADMTGKRFCDVKPAAGAYPLLS